MKVGKITTENPSFVSSCAAPKRNLLGAIFIAAVLLAFASLFGCSPKALLPTEIVSQSYDLGKQLDTFSRAHYLRTLLANTSDIVPHRQYEQWCDEMFETASNLTDGPSRVVEEKNAVSFLFKVNPSRAMRLIHRIEGPQPAWAGTLPEDVRSSTGAIAFGRDWRSATDSSHRPQISMVHEIRRLAQNNDLPSALALASQLTDDAIRIEGYTALLPQLIAPAPNNARQIYDAEKTRLQEVHDPNDQLRALVALAEASYYEKETDSFADFTFSAIGKGAALFAEDSRQRPQWPSSERDGYEDLSEMVRFAAAHGLKSLPGAIQRLDGIELNAHMLVFEARGLKDAQNASEKNF